MEFIADGTVIFDEVLAQEIKRRKIDVTRLTLVEGLRVRAPVVSLATSSARSH